MAKNETKEKKKKLYRVEHVNFVPAKSSKLYARNIENMLNGLAEEGYKVMPPVLTPTGITLIASYAGDEEGPQALLLPIEEVLARLSGTRSSHDSPPAQSPEEAAVEETARQVCRYLQVHTQDMTAEGVLARLQKEGPGILARGARTGELPFNTEVFRSVSAHLVKRVQEHRQSCKDPTCRTGDVWQAFATAVDEHLRTSLQ
jgi:hypothetical protein